MNRLNDAEAFRTIIDFKEWKKQVDKKVDDRFNKHNPSEQSPIEFLCLFIDRGNHNCFRSLDQAIESVRYCRKREAEFEVGLRPPIGILLVVDPPPSDVEEWRKDSVQRNELTELGALIVDRPESMSEDATDDQLCLEVIASAIQGVHPPGPTIQGGGFDFDWQPKQEVGPLGAEYGRQPAAIVSPQVDPAFPKRFDAYRGSPDVES